MTIDQRHLAGPYAPRLLQRLRIFVAVRLSMLLFLATFVLPTAFATLYYGFLASDRYVSEAQFIVRGVDGGQANGLSALLRTFGIARSNDDTFVINSYIKSRDAVAALSETIDLAAVYERPGADWFTRFGTILSGKSDEDLFDYYNEQLDLIENVETGITTMKVSAYRPEDAYAIASRLLTLGEARVNLINKRAHNDVLEEANRSMAESADAVVAAQLELTKFRNSESLLDPTNTASGNFEVIASLSEALSREEVRLRQLNAASPSNPAIGPMKERIASLNQQIAGERAKLTGPGNAIANKLGRYEELLMRRTLADSSFEAATQAIEHARQEAARQQIYLEQVVTAHTPDESTEPRRLRRIATIALLSISAFVMLYLLVYGSREHLNMH